MHSTQNTGNAVSIQELSLPRSLRYKNGPNVLALGGELKANVTLLGQNRIHWTLNLGDIKDAAAYECFRAEIARQLAAWGSAPDLIAHDLHPQFLSTQLAQEMQARYFPQSRLISVQHHTAHIAAAALLCGCADQTLIGLACDGTGYGSDHNVWGCECFVGPLDQLKRTGHLQTMPLPGADKVVVEPWRVAFGLLYMAYGQDALKLKLPGFRQHQKDTHTLMRMIEQGVNTPQASSAGRLFDGIAALIGVCPEQKQEAEAPRLLEKAAQRVIARYTKPYTVSVKPFRGRWIIRIEPLIRDIVSDLQNKVPAEEIAARFHVSFSSALVKLCRCSARQVQEKTVLLCGGVFFNTIISQLVQTALERAGYTVHLPAVHARGDSALSLGQAVMAYVRRCSG